jgi:hypothetical protein
MTPEGDTTRVASEESEVQARHSSRSSDGLVGWQNYISPRDDIAQWSVQVRAGANSDFKQRVGVPYTGSNVADVFAAMPTQ